MAEQYLEKVSNFKYRHALTQLRTSSHRLNIETGRHKDQKNKKLRLCNKCGIFDEDEIHFLLECPLYNTERKMLFDVYNINCAINDVNRSAIFVLLMSSKYQCHLEALGRYVYTCFNIRKNQCYE